TEGVDAAWAAEYGTVHGEDATSRARVEAYGRMLADLGPAAVAAVARHDGELAGVGFGVRERGWLGVFGVGTPPAHRRRGVARAVMAALAEGRDTYLQVERDNAAAQLLYQRLGFTGSHGYHYRVSNSVG
ncbi:MAG TPA: GNAT family N-acetyltransferase, partial [Iamia sp.]